MECVFCDYDKIKERIAYEDDLVFVIPALMAIVPGHMLVMPKRCVAKIDDLNEEELLRMHEVISKLKKSLVKVFDAEGFNHAWNEGGIAGQSVNHLHVHVLPRKDGDRGLYGYEPRSFLYRPGSRAESQAAELIEIARDIRENIE